MVLAERQEGERAGADEVGDLEQGEDVHQDVLRQLRRYSRRHDRHCFVDRTTVFPAATIRGDLTHPLRPF